MDYLECVVTREGSETQPKKIETILKLDKLKRLKDVHMLLGMVHYYRDLWGDRSNRLSPLIELTDREKRKKMVWTVECDLSFERIKQLLAQDVMLAYPNFEKKCHTH